MRRDMATIMTLGAIALSTPPLPAQSGPDVLGSAAVRAFLPVETRYAAAVQADGVRGLRREAATGFTVRHGNEHWTGDAAFAQIDNGIHGINGGRVAVTLRRLTVTVNTAVAVTREALTFPPITVNGQSATCTATWYWKQTWRRTGQEWKLSALEPLSEKEFGPAPMVEYTVWSDDHPAPAANASPAPK